MTQPFVPLRASSLCLLLIIIASCSKERTETPKPSAPLVQKPATMPPSATVHPVSGHYRSYLIDGASALSALLRSLGPDGMMLVYKLNRRDLKHLKTGDSIVIPLAADSILAYSPFPRHLDSLGAQGKLLVISRRVQAFAAYEHGTLVRWGPTSTGKRTTPTPEGLYHTNWKSKQTHSTVDDAWILNWYFNLDNLEGISLHEYDLPGYPASHSCVRLLSEDAEWIYHWADQWILTPDGARVATNGTPVIVFGNYAYGKIPPWKKLATDSSACDVNVSEVTSAVRTYLVSDSSIRK
ncbi:MAG: L,D-transpeptidase [Bacteroidetes bacterium]|nr:L,D-transpeptidase [Bacteroidota bacterium]